MFNPLKILDDYMNREYFKLSWRRGIASVCKRDGQWVRLPLGEDGFFMFIFCSLATRQSAAFSFAFSVATLNAMRKAKAGNGATLC